MIKEIPTRAVKAVITNENGEILFLQRNPAVRDNDSWDLPGGLVEEETDEEALIREVIEELGVVIEVGKSVGEWNFHRPLDDRNVKVSNFACRIKSGEITLSREHIASKWVPRGLVKELKVKDASIFEALG